jgi:hypothetical protein
LTGKPGQRRFSQANRIALTSSCRCYNSSRDDFAYCLRLASVVKLFERSRVSLADYGNPLGSKDPGLYERVVLHWGAHPPHCLSLILADGWPKGHGQAWSKLLSWPVFCGQNCSPWAFDLWFFMKNGI